MSPFNERGTADSNPRIGIYDTIDETWSFVFYPLDAPTSHNSGWVGLSDITSLGNDECLIAERDNQSGPDVTIKRLYKINLSTAQENPLVSKTLVVDLMDELKKQAV